MFLQALVRRMRALNNTSWAANGRLKLKCAQNIIAEELAYLLHAQGIWRHVTEGTQKVTKNAIGQRFPSLITKSNLYRMPKTHPEGAGKGFDSGDVCLRGASKTKESGFIANCSQDFDEVNFCVSCDASQNCWGLSTQIGKCHRVKRQLQKSECLMSGLQCQDIFTFTIKHKKSRNKRVWWKISFILF